jgi:hypothetical protein
MATPVSSSHPTESTRQFVDRSGLPKAGLIAGTIGAVTLAVWFLIIDLIQGRPLFTPTILGAMFFEGGAGLGGTEPLPITLELVLGFTFLHWLVFAAVGGVAAWLLEVADRNPSLGFGILLLFILFEFGFFAIAGLFAEPVLQKLTWWTVLLGNLLAAGSMAGYFWRRYGYVVIRP